MHGMLNQLHGVAAGTHEPPGPCILHSAHRTTLQRTCRMALFFSSYPTLTFFCRCLLLSARKDAKSDLPRHTERAGSIAFSA